MKDTIKFLQPAVSGVALGLLAATTADIAHALELGALTRLCAETSPRVGNSHLTAAKIRIGEISSGSLFQPLPGINA
jgi:hypothetical protein